MSSLPASLSPDPAFCVLLSYLVLHHQSAAQRAPPPPNAPTTTLSLIYRLAYFQLLFNPMTGDFATPSFARSATIPLEDLLKLAIGKISERFLPDKPPGLSLKAVRKSLGMSVGSLASTLYSTYPKSNPDASSGEDPTELDRDCGSYITELALAGVKFHEVQVGLEARPEDGENWLSILWESEAYADSRDADGSTQTSKRFFVSIGLASKEDQSWRVRDDEVSVWWEEAQPNV